MIHLAGAVLVRLGTWPFHAGNAGPGPGYLAGNPRSHRKTWNILENHGKSIVNIIEMGGMVPLLAARFDWLRV